MSRRFPRLRAPSREVLIGALLVVLSVLTALLLMDDTSLPEVDLVEGSVAPRTLRAPVAYEFVDEAATELRRQEAADVVPPVYAYDPKGPDEQLDQISAAFVIARASMAEALLQAHGEGLEAPALETLSAIAGDFIAATGLDLSRELLASVVESGFSSGVEENTRKFLEPVMRHFIIADSSMLPAVSGPITVIRFDSQAGQDQRLENFDDVWTVEKARGRIREQSLDLEDFTEDRWLAAGAAVARAAVRPNFSTDIHLTRFRRQEARSAVSVALISVARGTAIVREGDVVTSQQLLLLEGLKSQHHGRDFWAIFGAYFLLCGVLFGALGRFATLYIRKFGTRMRDLTSLAVLMLVTVGLARFMVDLSAMAAARGSMNLAPELAWYMVPVAGVVLMVRILMNSETALVFAIAGSLLCGFLMDQQVLYALFFAISSVTAASVLGVNQDRKAILKAGLLTGLANAGIVLLLWFTHVDMSGAVGAEQEFGQHLWSAGFALAGGFLSAFLVLALLPLFELVGFVTDLQLMELANLNHPLLRNLMLRAPGSYHHSVMVGSLSEAGAEAIGCNALLARVAAYFHDIGKAVTPQYFVENYRGASEPHARLTPHQSARVIIDHVRNGGAIAKRYKLPKPIVDNIYMHHGNGLLYYFYRKAQESNPDVDPADFRYPGPRPNTREAGIIHLADKVEAACRSIREPTPERIAAMIQKIINSTLADAQLEECPLTLQDLYTIAHTFQEVILAIHHQRIEYPDTQDISSATSASDAATAEVVEPVITLDLPPREAEEIREKVAVLPSAKVTSIGKVFAAEETDGGPVDYESADVIPDQPVGGPGGSGRKAGKV